MLVTSVRDVEAHFTTDQVEPLLTVDPTTQPASSTFPTWVDNPRSQMNMPIKNVRPRLRLQSVPSTIIDALEEDLEANVVSTVPANSRARRLVGQAMPPRPHIPEVRGPNAAVPALLDTTTDPDFSQMGGDENEALDEVIVNRATRAGLAMAYFGQAYFGQFLLWPILLWPILLWPVLLWPKSVKFYFGQFYFGQSYFDQRFLSCLFFPVLRLPFFFLFFVFLLLFVLCTPKPQTPKP